MKFKCSYFLATNFKEANLAYERPKGNPAPCAHLRTAERSSMCEHVWSIFKRLHWKVKLYELLPTHHQFHQRFTLDFFADILAPKYCKAQRN